MSRKLILIRHGNTFTAEETPVYVGAKTDLPLTDKGQEQGRLLGEELLARNLIPAAIYYGPLKRQQQTASEIQQAMSLDVSLLQEHLALGEVDYGVWEGKSEAEIREKWPNEFAAYTEQALWPEGIFGSSAAEMQGAVAAFLAEMMNRQEVTAAVTSNGVLRIVFSLLTPEWNDLTAAGNASAAKVRTGAYCILDRAGGSWSIEEWDRRPGKAIAKPETAASCCYKAAK